MTFGERLKKIRKERNLSVEKLSHMSGIHENTIRSWESDNREPTLFNVSCVSIALGVSLDYLAFGKGSDE